MKRLNKPSNYKLSDSDFDTLQNMGDIEVRLYGGINGQPYRTTLKPNKSNPNIGANLRSLYTRSQNESLPWSDFDSLRMKLITNPRTASQRKKMADFLDYISTDAINGGYAHHEVMPKIVPHPVRGSQTTKRMSKSNQYYPDNIKPKKMSHKDFVARIPDNLYSALLSSERDTGSRQNNRRWSGTANAVMNQVPLSSRVRRGARYSAPEQAQIDMMFNSSLRPISAWNGAAYAAMPKTAEAYPSKSFMVTPPRLNYRNATGTRGYSRKS